MLVFEVICLKRALKLNDLFLLTSSFRLNPLPEAVSQSVDRVGTLSVPQVWPPAGRVGVHSANCYSQDTGPVPGYTELQEGGAGQARTRPGRIIYNHKQTMLIGKYCPKMSICIISLLYSHSKLLLPYFISE